MSDRDVTPADAPDGCPTPEDWLKATEANIGDLLDRVGLLRPVAGDIVVIESASMIRKDTADYIAKQVKSVLPDGVECLLLDSGLRLTRSEASSLHDDVQRKTADRIATALERLVELAEPDGITPDIVVDTDGKLMHCTGTLPGCEVATTGPPLPPIPDRDYSAYVVAHDPTAAILAACEFWGYARAELTNLKADYDD